VFIDRAAAALGGHADLKHSLEENAEAGTVTLTIPRRREDGFDVVVEAAQDGLFLFAGDGAHVQFDEILDPQRGSVEDLVDEALGLARDLLSPSMRVRELRAGGRPYRWSIEYYHDSGWHAEHETVLLFWNYLGRRSERLYRNHTLPSRFIGGEPPG
jgi:hypothetical protein